MREISEHVLDIVQNSIKAESYFTKILIDADKNQDMLTIIIKDNGCGMNEDFLKDVCDPFSTSRTTRKVGLGIPLFKDTAEKSDGSFWITSCVGIGTVVTAKMKISHIDRPPLGGLSETMHILIVSNPDIDFNITFKSGDEIFRLSTCVLKETLGEVPLNNLDVSSWIKISLIEGKNLVFGGISL